MSKIPVKTPTPSPNVGAKIGGNSNGAPTTLSKDTDMNGASQPKVDISKLTSKTDDELEAIKKDQKSNDGEKKAAEAELQKRGNGGSNYSKSDIAVAGGSVAAEGAIVGTGAIIQADQLNKQQEHDKNMLEKNQAHDSNMFMLNAMKDMGPGTI